VTPSSPNAGAERIAKAFREHGKRAALMPYVMGGYPNLETSKRIGAAYVEAGADLIELGFPYSDPLADGPVIQAAGSKAIANGTSFTDVLCIGRSLAPEVPVVLMTYANVVFARHLERFTDDLAAAGISGVIIPDLSLEEAPRFRDAFDTAGLALVPLVAPSTPDERMRQIGAEARGFLYAVAVGGTTGERAELAPGVAEVISRARASTEVPVALGFGISKPKHAEQAAELGAEGVIVASRLVREAGEVRDPAERLRRIVRQFAAVLRVRPKPSRKPRAKRPARR
jgi:tryptophan synthase alpha chain